MPSRMRSRINAICLLATLSAIFLIGSLLDHLSTAGCTLIMIYREKKISRIVYCLRSLYRSLASGGSFSTCSDFSPHDNGSWKPGASFLHALISILLTGFKVWSRIRDRYLRSLVAGISSRTTCPRVWWSDLKCARVRKLFLSPFS